MIPRFGIFQLYSAALMLLLSCSGNVKSSLINHSHEAYNILSLRWLKQLGPKNPNIMIPEMAEEHDRFHPVETSSAGFDTDKQRIFIGSFLGGLYCIDIKSGKTVWFFDTDDSVGSIPLYDAGRKYVYFGGDDGNYYALHARSGRLIWKINLNREITGKTLLARDTLYVKNANDKISALSPENGKVLWEYSREPVEGFAATGNSGLIIRDSTMFTGFSDGTLAAIDINDGTLLWSNNLTLGLKKSVAGDEIVLLDADATPVVTGEMVVAASIAGGLYAFNVETGKTIWTRADIGQVTGLIHFQKTVFAACSGKGLEAVELDSGKSKWILPFDAGVLSDPVLDGDLLYLSDSINGIFVISVINGRILQRLNQYNGFYAKPSIMGGYLIVLGNRGVLYAMKVK